MEHSAEKYLYFYEHKMIPSMFYADKPDFFAALAEDPGILFEIFNDACKGNEIEQPYAPDDFDVEKLRMDDEYLCLKLTFPIPKRVTLCFEIYLFQKLDRTGRGCYTLERAKDAGGNVLILGGWDAEEKHHNYGNFPMEDEDFCAKAFEIHRKSN